VCSCMGEERESQDPLNASEFSTPSAADESLTPRPYEALYIHVPFCTARCAYCAFYSVAGAPNSLRQRWLARVRQEFAEFAERSAPLCSVYIGGGTPTVLGPAELRALFQAVRDWFRLSPDAEVTVECNPETLTPARADALAEGGVNRVSLGVQTWRPPLRAILERRGSIDAIPRAVAALRTRGIGNIGVDLIYGIPGQTLAAWRDDLRRTVDLDVVHVSTYELTIEEGTRLARGGTRPVQPDLVPEYWALADAVLGQAGMQRYEVSNFARPGCECRHNLWVWYGGTYAGCGPSACSFDGAVRTSCPADIERWLAGAPPEVDRLPREARAAEILAFGLRTAAGWDVATFVERTGCDPFELRGAQLQELESDGLIVISARRIRATARGLLFADTIAERLL